MTRMDFISVITCCTAVYQYAVRCVNLFQSQKKAIRRLSMTSTLHILTTLWRLEIVAVGERESECVDRHQQSITNQERGRVVGTRWCM